MKVFATLAFAILSLQSFAIGQELGFFKCASDPSMELIGMYHEVKIDMSMKHFGQNTLKVPYGSGRTIVTEAAQVSGRFDVKIAFDADEISSNDPDVLYMSERKSAQVTNDLFYQPRKYKNFARFSLPMDTMGVFDLILPNSFIKGEITKTDKAVLVLTYILDHHGATVPLSCEKYAEPI
jgi:hypothetical protein